MIDESYGSVRVLYGSIFDRLLAIVIPDAPACTNEWTSSGSAVGGTTFHPRFGLILGITFGQFWPTFRRSFGGSFWTHFRRSSNGTDPCTFDCQAYDGIRWCPTGAVRLLSPPHRWSSCSVCLCPAFVSYNLAVSDRDVVRVQDDTGADGTAWGFCPQNPPAGEESDVSESALNLSLRSKLVFPQTTSKPPMR